MESKYKPKSLRIFGLKDYIARVHKASSKIGLSRVYYYTERAEERED